MESRARAVGACEIGDRLSSDLQRDELSPREASREVSAYPTGSAHTNRGRGGAGTSRDSTWRQVSLALSA